MKKKRKRKPFFQKGYRHEIMRRCLNHGGLSYTELELENGKIATMYMRKIRDMCEEGYLYKKRVDGTPMVVISSFDTKYLDYISCYEMGTYGFYKDYIKNDVDGTYQEDMIDRKVKMFETATFCEKAGINVGYKSKADIRFKEKIERESMCYYSATEMKVDMQEEVEAFKKISSRSMGCMISPGGLYVMYNLGKRRIRTNDTTESKNSIIFGQFAAKHVKGYKGNPKGISDAVFIAQNNKVLSDIILNDVGPSLKKAMISTDFSFDSMYGITYDQTGLEQLKTMTRKDWKETVREKYLPNGLRNGLRYGVDCDGTDGENFYLIFCVPDLKRLAQFIKSSRIAIEGQGKYHVYCYEYQRDLVETVCGEEIVIHVVEEGA